MHYTKNKGNVTICLITGRSEGEEYRVEKYSIENQAYHIRETCQVYQIRHSC